MHTWVLNRLPNYLVGTDFVTIHAQRARYFQARQSLLPSRSRAAWERTLLDEWSLRMIRPTGSPLKVLLVDDDNLIQRAGQALLGALGHQTTLAKHGREAIEILETQTFDAVMLDLTMPVMSGKEAFIEIHRRWPELPVAICTGYFVDIKQWLVSPDDTPPYVLQKPYSVAELIDFLATTAEPKGASPGSHSGPARRA